MLCIKLYYISKKFLTNNILDFIMSDVYQELRTSDAEKLFDDLGWVNGNFLIRICPVSKMKVLSLSFDGEIYHHAINVSPEGQFSLTSHKLFPSLHYLIRYYTLNKEILEHHLTLPINLMSSSFCSLNQHLLNNSLSSIQIASKCFDDNFAWYHGNLLRSEADQLLFPLAEASELYRGYFLVRDRYKAQNDYVLSLNSGIKVVHYHIRKQLHQGYFIHLGENFDTPIEIIHHYKHHLGGLINILSTPCYRKEGVPLLRYKFVPFKQLSEAAKLVSLKLGFKAYEIEKAILLDKWNFNLELGSLLTQHLSWFHGSIKREEAELKLLNYGYNNGLFLVREKPDRNYAICMVYNNVVLHYLVNFNDSNRSLYIEDGIYFCNLMQLVDFYAAEAEGLMCTLNEICPRDGKSFVTSDSESNLHTFSSNFVFNSNLVISRKLIKLTQSIGDGNFGSVLEGIFFQNELSIPCAVKMLKVNIFPDRKSQILDEAEAMSKLAHPNIVKLFGVCLGDPILLVMELCSFGPVNIYLQKNLTFPFESLLNFIKQVCEGMTYLETIKFVHRDLAARNVLMETQYQVKISDFGMSRALDLGSDYYKASELGVWPMKWYAPECIYYKTFTSKGDVWSFGVATWEILSFGEKPFKNMSGPDILKYLDNGGRLNRPKICTTSLYDILLQCWQYDPKKRLSFAEINFKLNNLYRSPMVLNSHVIISNKYRENNLS